MLFDLVRVTFVVVSYFQRPFLAFRLCVLGDKEMVCVGRASQVPGAVIPVYVFPGRELSQNQYLQRKSLPAHSYSDQIKEENSARKFK